ncbi:MAG: hypothetical protein CMQ34_15225 [Gammaproteobacteria bacterium]|nr:hypothetical protein [Gammaproteobacteria bacterium]MBC55178.1 hypothetical protein [Gammaproteobacteria bacterium]
MASPQTSDTLPDNRIEPSILTDLSLDDDARHAAQPSSHGVLSATLFVSILAHGIILFMATYAANRDHQQADRTIAAPSIQIRFQSPPRRAPDSPLQSAAAEPASVTTDNVDPTAPSAVADTAAPAEAGADTSDPAASASLAETPVSPATPPLRQLPSLTDLRTAARNRAEQDRRGRATHPDCLRRDRRSAFLDCAEEAPYDFASAGQNPTVVFFTPALPSAPANDSEQRTTTGARVKAAIDMFDNQLGTTQTRKRIMNFP